MISLINLSLLALFVIFTFRIFSSKSGIDAGTKIIKCDGHYYQISDLLLYVIFIVCTAPFFLGEWSLGKYGFFFITLLALIAKGKIKCIGGGIVVSYIIFLLWMIVCLFWTQYRYAGFMLIIKYSLPLLSLCLGYSSISNTSDLFVVTKIISKWIIVYAFVIGGYTSVMLPNLNWNLSKIFLAYAGLADYFTSLIVIFFVINWITNNKKFYIGALILFISSLLDVVRTGIGGIIIACSMFNIFRYKIKALPSIFLFGLIFLGVVLFVPKVNEKFFGDEAGSVSANDIVKGDAMSQDNIKTHGRSEMWEYLMAKFYEPHKVIGSGTGTSTGFLKDKKFGYNETEIVLIHSDYVQLLCDNGLVGISLLGLFFLSVLISMTKEALFSNYFYCKISAALAISSLAGTAFAMAYDNVVSHSMTSLINPFIFIGFFLKFKELKNDKSLS